MQRWGVFLSLSVSLLLFLLLSVVLSVTFGSVSIPVEEVYKIMFHNLSGGRLFVRDWSGGTELIVWDIRFPRIVISAFAGAVFALSGVFMQTLTQNPVAEPYILGVSSGASAGAVCAIIFGFSVSLGGYAVSAAAFAGALLSLFMVLLLVGNRPSPLRLVLLGMGVSAFFSALTTFVLNEAQNDSQLRSAVFWMLGSFSSVQWRDLPVITVGFAVSITSGLLLSKDLDVILLGDVTSGTLGVPVRKIKTVVAILSAVIVSLAVSRTGVIGFVGLIIPHTARRLSGIKHRRLMITSSLLGAIFMIWADTLARTLFRPEEIPVGVLTSLIGAPLFVWIIKKDYSFGGQS